MLEIINCSMAECFPEMSTMYKNSRFAKGMISETGLYLSFIIIGLCLEYEYVLLKNVCDCSHCTMKIITTVFLQFLGVIIIVFILQVVIGIIAFIYREQVRKLSCLSMKSVISTVFCVAE